jgi:hypothetical protein
LAGHHSGADPELAGDLIELEQAKGRAEHRLGNPDAAR